MTSARSAHGRLAIAITGPSGSGKSTTAGLLRRKLEGRGLRVEVLKLAEPLYRLQSEFYRCAGREVDRYAQDQPLLESIAAHLRRISPRALVDDLLRRLEQVDADVVLNDDLRDPHVDWPVLRAEGFRVVRVRAPDALRVQRLAQRGDLAVVADSATTRAIDEIEPSFTVSNAGTLEDLEAEVDACVSELIR